MFKGIVYLNIPIIGRVITIWDEGGMCTLKHEISSPKFYDILVKIELKGGTTM